MSGIEFNKVALKQWECDGLTCAVVEAPIYGAINGYVRVPERHPDFGKDYDEVGVDIHGGLTYSDESGWFGFDTLHLYDNWPGMDEPLPGTDWRHGTHPDGCNWTQFMVERETERLAEQLAKRGWGDKP